ncbi:MAG: multicopper oxidase domain-containing protein [Gemmatirosa sp.]
MRSVVPPLLVLAVIGGALVAASPAPLEPARTGTDAHAARASAGAWRGDTLTLRLEARTARWLPAGVGAPGAPGAPGALVPTFAEVGRAAELPGPLVRVPAGTVVVVRLHNALADTLHVHGLHDRSASTQVGDPPDGVHLAPGATRTLPMRLDAPGSYGYWGTTAPPHARTGAREEAPLTGVIVVDPPR